MPKVIEVEGEELERHVTRLAVVVEVGAGLALHVFFRCGRTSGVWIDADGEPVGYVAAGVA